MTFNTPTLLWSQTPESVDISIRLSNIEDETVSCENNKFLFSCSSQSKNYRIEFDLDKSVEKVSYNKYDNRIVIVLEKAEYEKWEFLTKVRGIYKNNIKIDWDKWEDSEGEEVDSPVGGNLGSPQTPSSGFGGMDMDMMRQMMGGMDMDSMRQMMGGMNMGGEEDGEEGEDGEEDGDEGEEDGDEEDGQEGEEDGQEGEEDGQEGEEGEEDGQEGEEGEEDREEGETCANETE